MEASGGGACETVTFTASHGTEVRLVYPIEPVLPLDDLTANVQVMSAKAGVRIGFRVRYPYLRDAESRLPEAVIVYGASYQSPGQFASIGVGMIERPLRMKGIALRQQYGSEADLSDAYVDAIVINAYSGPGTTALRMDELRVDGLIPLGDAGVMGGRAGNAQRDRLASDARAIRLSSAPLLRPSRLESHSDPSAQWRAAGLGTLARF